MREGCVQRDAAAAKRGAAAAAAEVCGGWGEVNEEGKGIETCQTEGRRSLGLRASSGVAPRRPLALTFGAIIEDELQQRSHIAVRTAVTASMAHAKRRPL